MRGMPRWVAVLAVVAMVAMVCAFTVRHVLSPAAILVHVSQTTLPGDGFASTELTIHSSTGRDLHGLRVEVDEPHRAVVDFVAVDRGSAVISVRAGVLPGETKIQLTAPGFVPMQIELRTTAETSDSVGDGTPDFLRLHDPADRAAFRRWFTLLAEAQYYSNYTSPAGIDDCAALLRYAYREALRQHDSAWAKSVALPTIPTADDIHQYQYPYTPLGAGLFRIREGSFVTEDLNNGAFVQFAD